MRGNLLTVLCFLVGTLTITAQEYEWSMPSGTLDIHGVKNVVIVGHEANHVTISVEEWPGQKQSEDERAKGLRAVNAFGGDNNTGVGLALITEEDHAVITPMNSSDDRIFTFHVPAGVNVTYEISSNVSGNVKFRRTKGEVEATMMYGTVELTDLEGPASISTVYGTIEGTFAAVHQEAPMHLYSEYGAIDLSVPSTANANFRMKTSWGKTFTDLDLEYESETKDGMRKLTSPNLIGKLNGGGVLISAITSYSNIYLRKA